jgi:dTDP-4-amino-4,6-dideoxygalactose transaminase
LNNRLDELQAAILRVKLKHLDRENEKRKAVANVYLREIKNPAVTLPSTLDCCLPCWHLFVVRVARRDHFIKYLEGHGVGVAIHYPIPPHQQKAYAKWNSCSYPITESIHERCVSLPISPAHTEDDARVVSSAINQYNEV